MGREHNREPDRTNGRGSGGGTGHHHQNKFLYVSAPVIRAPAPLCGVQDRAGHGQDGGRDVGECFRVHGVPRSYCAVQVKKTGLTLSDCISFIVEHFRTVSLKFIAF